MSKVLSLLLAVLIPFQAHATVWFDNIHADTMNFERRDESSAATVNALDSSKTYVKLTGTVTTINGITAPSSPHSRFILISNQAGAEVTFNHQNASAAAADRLVLTNAEPLKVPNGGSATFMYDHGQSRWVTAGGGGGNASGVSLVRDIAQTAHGFAACDVIRHNGTSYVKAQADSEGNAEVYGIVTEVQDAHNFTVTTHGYASCFSGLTAGTYYFLSASTAGAYTVTAPTTVGHVVKPIFFALSATEGNLGIYRGNVVSAATDATEITYSPSDPTDWDVPPDDVAEALDAAMGAVVSHETQATGAHAATAISVSASKNLDATQVQAALERDAKHLSPRNYVINPSALVDETTSVTWTNVTAGRNTSNVSLPDGAAEFSFTVDSASDTVEWAIDAYPSLSGLTCVASLYYTSASASVDLQVRRNSATVASQTLTASTTPKFVQLPFDCGDASNATTVRIAGTSATSTAMKVTKVGVYAPGSTQAVINTGGDWVGAAKWTGTTSCNWARTSNRSFANFSANASCPDPSVTGQVTAPGTKVPALTVTVDPKYVYRFVAVGEFRATTANVGCAWRFSDGTNNSSPQVAGFPNSEMMFPQVTGELSPTTAGSVTVHLQGTGANNNGACTIESSASGVRELQIAVYRFPKSSSVTGNIFEAGDYGWTSYTPTFTGLGTPTNVSIRHKRIGDTLYVEGSFITGTVSAADVSMTLPSGLAINSSKLPTDTGGMRKGEWHIVDGNIADTFQGDAAGVVFYDGSDTAKLYFSASQTAGTGYDKSDGNVNFISNRLYDVSFSVPISGWSTFPFGVANGDVQTPAYRGTGNAVLIWAKVANNTCVSTPCTIDSQSGDFTSITRSAQGKYSANFNSTSGITEIIYCRGASYSGSDSHIESTSTAPTTSAWSFEHWSSTSSASDGKFAIFCLGVK